MTLKNIDFKSKINEKIWGKRVLLPDGWSDNTLIEIDAKWKIKILKKTLNLHVILLIL